MKKVYNGQMAILIGSCLLLIMGSCSDHKRYFKSSERAFESRMFDRAVAEAVNSLYAKPEKNDKAKKVLEMAFPRFIDQYEQQISSLEQQAADFKGQATLQQRKQIVEKYQTLIKFTGDVKNLPSDAFRYDEGKRILFEFNDYSEQLAAARENVESGKESTAEMLYQQGLELMEAGGLENNRSAAKKFKEAMRFVPNFRDSQAKYEEARKAGTIRIAILPFENKSGTNQYGAIGEMITDKVVSSLFADRGAMEFLEVIDREQLNIIMAEQQLSLSGMVDESSIIDVGRVIGVHEIVTGRITQIINSDPRPTTERRTVKNTVKVQDGFKLNDEGKKVPVYKNQEVGAVVTKYTKTASATMSGSFKVIDIQTARILETKTFDESYNFQTEWGTFRGDERAITGGFRRLVNATEEAPLSRGERVNFMGNKLAQELASTIKRYAQ